MAGLSVLYAREAVDESEWATIPDRDKTGRLREIYWARRADLKTGRKSFLNMQLYWRADRTVIGRRGDEPGDSFIYVIDLPPRNDDRFEWLEVTEVFTTVPAPQIEGAMRAWNGIPDRCPVDFGEFRTDLHRGRPSRIMQRMAADRVIAQVENKLTKTSYNELLEKYGYGTLVVGLPLWFAVPPDNPFRVKNAVDDFVTRTTLGLEDIKRRVLERWKCPFKNVIVIWDTTPLALREWRDMRSAEYGDAANARLENPLGVSLSDSLEDVILKTRTAESEAPSMSLHLSVRTLKKGSGKGPFPAFVEALRKVMRKRKYNPVGLRVELKLKVALALFKLLCFVRVRRVKEFERWFSRKFSVSHAFGMRAAQRKARRFYRESQRRGRVFGEAISM